MRFRILAIIFAVVLPCAAQAPPVKVLKQKPHLKRDRTQRILYPKIIQREDERIVDNELLDMLFSPHWGVRRHAIIALGRIGSPAGVAPLVAILNSDKDPEMRALAAFSLGEIESHYAVPALLERLSADEKAVVRGRVAEALGKIAANKVSAASLGEHGLDQITDALVHLLNDAASPPSADAKFMASLALTALLRLKKARAIEAIAHQLRSPDADLRWQAANALARIGEGISVAIPTLITLLTDDDPLVRAHAARALGVGKDKSAVEALIRLLGDADERVVASSTVALGLIADNRATDALIAMGNRLLNQYRAFDRETGGVPPQQNLLLLVATALGNIRDARAIPFLKALRFQDGQLGSSPEVEVAMAKFGEAAFFDIPEGVGLPTQRWQAVAAYAQGLGELGTERAKKILLELFKQGEKLDPRAMPDILRALRAAQVEGLRDILLGQLKAEDVIVRAEAARLLGEMGDASEVVTSALEQALKAARSDKMNDARIAIIEAAARLKHPLSFQVLSEPTRDRDYIVRQRAFELLRESGVQTNLVKLQVGKVETGHDRAYYKLIAQLMGARKNPLAIIHTKKGDIRIELLAADAPMTVYNFIQLAKRGFYDGLSFMRVVPNFVLQAGDPRNDMHGGPGYQIRCEINLRPYLTGTVGMALSGKDTGGSQFFITHSPQPHLDGGYTVFGQVVAGMDVVNKIARGDLIEHIEIIEQQ
jgi:cyclophilin family peptidyl-prolyl cis-trans isomerase/HEAT repeat protein